MPRFYCPTDLHTGEVIELPAGAARHVQVLRLQPGDGITLFNGQFVDAHGTVGEFAATVTHMGRSAVQVQVGDFVPTHREPGLRVHLAVGMPANERMDWLVEKAAELGAASIQPLTAERSVLRLSGERADKKRAHWQSIAIAACEQCGGNRVPPIHPVMTLAQWLASPAPTCVARAPRTADHERGLPLRVESGMTASAAADAPLRLLLSLGTDTRSLREAVALCHGSATQATRDASSAADVLFLSGPEGGLSPAEEDAARAARFTPVTLGARVLRAETAALAALAALLT